MVFYTTSTILANNSDLDFNTSGFDLDHDHRQCMGHMDSR